jgi:hypothetical protein
MNLVVKPIIEKIIFYVETRNKKRKAGERKPNTGSSIPKT